MHFEHFKYELNLSYLPPKSFRVKIRNNVKHRFRKKVIFVILGVRLTWKGKTVDLRPNIEHDTLLLAMTSSLVWKKQRMTTCPLRPATRQSSS